MAKKVIVALALLGAGIAMLGQPKNCLSAFCPDIKCLNNTECGPGCVCLKRGMDASGECASIDAVPQLVEAGYRAVP